MPAWSTEVANEYIALARAEGVMLDQSKLQRLVYIAHGHLLSICGQPLTGDRPEAWDYGPVYQRLAAALSEWGNKPVRELISIPSQHRLATTALLRNVTILDQVESRVLERTYGAYASMENAQLAELTRGKGSPWQKVFDRAGGRKIEIGHELIRKQFESLAEQSKSRFAPDDFD